MGTQFTRGSWHQVVRVRAAAEPCTSGCANVLSSVACDHEERYSKSGISCLIIRVGGLRVCLFVRALGLRSSIELNHAQARVLRQKLRVTCAVHDERSSSARLRTARAIPPASYLDLVSA